MKPNEYEITVRYIPIETAMVKGALVMTGNKPALCFESPDQSLAVLNGELEVEVRTLSRRELETSPLVKGPSGEVAYPPERFLQRILESQHSRPINSQAWRLLKIVGATGEIPEPLVAPDKERLVAGKKGGPNWVPLLAEEFGLSPQQVRKALRKAGMKAPYDDEAKIRSILSGV